MPTVHVDDQTKRILVDTDKYSAAVNTEGYVSGVAAGSFIDRATGAHDPGFGLMIVDFLLEPGKEPADTPPELHYVTGDEFHGSIDKRYVALPQICTQAKQLPHQVVQGTGYAAVRQWFTWNIGCPPYPAGARWEQTLLFPDGKRWFLAWDRFACTKDSTHVEMRMDMPCHIKHHGGDVFKQVYLSYRETEPGRGYIPQTEFHENFRPEAKFLYRRNPHQIPKRYIRAMQLENGVWLAGMALDPAVVYEAWCHQRDYVCFIQEVGGRKTRSNEWQNSVHLVGYFDNVDEMERTFDQYRGTTGLAMSEKGWSVVKGSR